MNSAKLEPPVRELLDDTLPEHEVHRLWSRIARGEERSPRASVWSVVVAAGVVLAVVGFWLARIWAPSPLRLADRREVPSLVAPRQDTALPLDDGSVVSVRAGSRLEVLESTGKAFSLALRRGHVVFDVRPSGPRTWRVECGSVAVEVVGTRFTVDRFLEQVTVSVERGAVLVRGDSVPDQVLRLSAGQSLTLDLKAKEAARLSGTEPAPSGPTAGKNGSTEKEVPPERRGVSLERVPTEPSTFGRLPQEARPVATIAAPPPSAAAEEDGPPGDNAVQDPARLFQSADAARREGRPGDAASLLTLLLKEYPADSRAPLAELTLGRMYLDALGQPDLAAFHLVRALGFGLPIALAEDAAARVVEAHARSGSPERAARARARYVALYPSGAHTEYVNRWAPPGP